ncbi:RDD family protein [Arthrobacter crusticola]|uniref:RDD family protein n=1 Tax=Arthrobacter crusticola TaxID=2547960 RepID=A0A4R5TZS7_9MICC|nr:RDD family protein [Arthrobacter crusticola]TDK26807.1 RDD family protein [Arthrobacter crusticola]
MDSVVTGEAVVLELRSAGFAARALSSIIDTVAQIVVFLGILFLVGSTLGGILDPALTRALTLVLVILVFLILPVTIETLTRGKSLGRVMLGLRIVRDDGGAIRFRHAFIRGMLAVLEIYLLVGSLAFVVALFNERSKRLGDLLAGTYALRERVVVKPRAVPEVPHHLQAWASTADIGRLPDPLARRVSQFLAQAPRLTPQSRAALAAELAREVGTAVAPAPPRGTHPEDFLAAVAAARRGRDYSRMLRQKEVVGSTAERLHRLPFSR